MNLKKLTPRKALNKAFLKVKPNRSAIECFKNNLIKLIDQIDEKETEEFHKNIVSAFLREMYYGAEYYINTKGRNDLVIHNGKDAQSSVGVIIETKKPANKTEMLTVQNLNVKAFHELVLYYLRERITAKNNEIKYLIATDIYEWFIFDAALFEKAFGQNKRLVKQFTDFEEGRLVGKTTDFFYKEIAESVESKIENDITFTHFDIREYEKPLRNADNQDDTALVALYKLLSPEHLLKLPFVNDSNSLDKSFYTELLHIIGLEETKEGGKKLIQRKKENERNTSSFIENSIIQLESLDKISRLEKPDMFGATDQERLYNVALELAITWINRILFLKLLEAQQINYHKGDTYYAFLNGKKVRDFEDLNSLFFSVLARKQNERNADVKKLFANVPYLNSSLFEPTDIEHSCLFISQLKDGELPILHSTVLKDTEGKKRTGKLNTLEYLFEFLDAYDFSSEGAEDIQEENKTLINASVLGLIFEKINGYKDGSFFTPGFITMYMCRETIRRAVFQKFNEVKKWDCKDLNQLYDKIEDKKETNALINSLKICDPAVGSGHFLVSALNEIIAIKSELKVLLDRQGKTLRDYQVEVVNDELIITDDDGQLFEYNPKSKESQNIQETLFHEKQTIIENCLFGVDINPNSVKICRLRLWIELLKNAYYTASSGYTQLETLPNIDINIKCGNSLISRYSLDSDIKKALQKSKWKIESYCLAVMTYRNAKTKEEKREMEKLINEIKHDFEVTIIAGGKEAQQLEKLRGEVENLILQTTMFGMTQKQKQDWEKNSEKATKALREYEQEIQDIKSSKIYHNAFEWRFEFPEVLNDEGDFVGFDVVIGNPPYIRVEFIDEKQVFYYKNNFRSATGKFDISSLFIEKSLSLLQKNGQLKFISSYQFIYTSSATGLRKFLTENAIGSIIMFPSDKQIFENAITYTGIFNFVKGKNDCFLIFQSDIVQNEIKIINELKIFNKNFISKKVVVADTTLFDKIFSLKHVVIAKEIGVAKCGVVSSADDVFFISKQTLDKENLERELIYPILGVDNLYKYYLSKPLEYCIYPYYIKNGKTELYPLNILKGKFPNIYQYFIKNQSILKKRSQGRKDYTESENWYQLNRPREKWIYDSVKIIAPGTINISKFALDTDKNLFRNARLYSFILNEIDINYYKILLAILNSSLGEFFLKFKCPPKNNGYFELSTSFLEEFPFIRKENIGKINLLDIVSKILAIKKSNPNANIVTLENEIDKLVYKLYDLTEDEIRIVEGETK